MARPKRFELLTPRFVVWCSIQLSYGRVPHPGRASRGPADGRIANVSGPDWQGSSTAAQDTGFRPTPGIAGTWAFGTGRPHPVRRARPCASRRLRSAAEGAVAPDLAGIDEDFEHISNACLQRRPGLGIIGRGGARGCRRRALAMNSEGRRARVRAERSQSRRPGGRRTKPMSGTGPRKTNATVAAGTAQNEANADGVDRAERSQFCCCSSIM